MTESLLIKNGTIITLGKPGRVLFAHDLYIQDSVIRKIAPSIDLIKADRTIDASAKIVLPGFINSHMHCYSTFARGLTKTTPATSFPSVLKNLWWRLDKALTIEDCYYSALTVLLEAIRHGTTTLIDHHASPGAIRGSLANIAKAFSETGLRGCLSYEVSDRDGARATAEGLEENSAFVQTCQERNDPRLKALFGLHASFTLSDLTLQTASRVGHDLGIGFHIHVAESAADQEYTVEHYGRRVVERLYHHDILGPGCIAAHCVHIDEKEMDILAQSGTAVVHNPQSNLNNAVGIADLVAMHKKGVLVGLGTDAMTTRMTEELRTALWCQHALHQNPSVGFIESASTLLVNNPKIARSIFNMDLGTIAEGSPADIILVDFDPATPLHEENWMGQIIFGLSQAAVDTTIVAGNVLMQNKKLLLNLDEKEIYCKAREHAEGLWKRM
jgi:putative selenium metabolism protein SsnA